MVKLTDKNITLIIRHAEIQKDETTKSSSLMYKILQRRVQQLRKEYTGEILRLVSTRRPKTELSDKDKEIIQKAWNEERVGSKLLYYDLKAKGHKIPHYKINNYFLDK